MRGSTPAARPIGLRYLGHDQRGWHVYIEDARPWPPADDESPKIFRFEREGKLLELVQQACEMKVYVNTDPHGADEWEIGEDKIQIHSPQSHPPDGDGDEPPAQ
ncbi:hypothetical protein N9L68_02885 [bacterium]|nr:hypothetical protein [bacterium]